MVGPNEGEGDGCKEGLWVGTLLGEGEGRVDMDGE